MASKFSENDFSCPVCCDVFKDPVLLLCSHSVCKDCLQQFWRTIGLKECPVCGMRSSVSMPPRNLALKNLCEIFLKEKIPKSSAAASETDCVRHNEAFKLFCHDDQQLVCVVCRDSIIHTNHKFSPIDEAATKHKKKIESSLNELKNILKLFQTFKQNCNQTEQYIKTQAQQTKQHIKEEFKKFHQFLHDEEEVRITALNEEEKQKIVMIKKKIEKLNSDIASLSNTIRLAEEEIRTKDVLFLKNYKTTLKRTHCTVQHPEKLSAALIDVAQHLSNLNFRVWKTMQHVVQFTPVTLDPNTAHPGLTVSNDLNCVRFSKMTQKLPDNVERFKMYPMVFGNKSFNSGKHCWDVEVGNCTSWSVGMMLESAARSSTMISKSGLWRVGYLNGKYGAQSTPHSATILSVAQKLQRIRVQLDWEGGTLTFFDPLTNTHLHCFICEFTDKLVPFIHVACEAVSLKILPADISVK